MLRRLAPLIVIVAVVGGCAGRASQAPYHASQARVSEVVGNAYKIQPGMSPGQVRRLVGDPDETRKFSYFDEKQQKRTGMTLAYILQRNADGSTRELQVNFDTDRNCLGTIWQNLDQMAGK